MMNGPLRNRGCFENARLEHRNSINICRRNEKQVVSWIGELEENDIEHVVFHSFDEGKYESGSIQMQNAGYEETGKSYLRENIKTYGRFFYCITAFGICLVGAVIEVYRNEGSVK